MQPQQVNQQGVALNPEHVLEAYRERLSEAEHSGIMQKVYARQLEERLREIEVRLVDLEKRNTELSEELKNLKEQQKDESLEAKGERG